VKSSPASVDVVIQATRLRDGSRRITHITEVIGMEGDVIITQDLMKYEIHRRRRQRQDHRPSPVDRHWPPAFWDRARYYGEDKRLAAALDAMESRDAQ
jgi:pilus assembly protein CpaF